MLGYKLFSDNETNVENVTVVLDDVTVLSADSSHSNFAKIKAAVVNGDRLTDAEYEDLFSPAKAIVNRFALVGAGVTVRGNDLFYEGEQLNGVLANKIVQLFEEDLDYGPFVKFLEKLTSPFSTPEENEFRAENLFRWLDTEDFTIDEDGDIIGYKYVDADRLSYRAGENVYRNGELLPWSRIPNHDGDVISMDRKHVQNDPEVGCSFGLHVGAWAYMGSGDTILKVKVNPRDVVSVPTECNARKMRVCRYVVVGQVEDKITSSYDRAYPVSEDVEDELSWDDIGDYNPEAGLVDTDDDDDFDPPQKFSQVRDYPGLNGVPAFYDPSQIVMNLQHKVDTRNNYKTQPRDENGRFLPKS